MQQAAIRETGAAAEERAPFLQLRDISKAYGPTFANRELSFDVHRGEVIGLIGANGAGKSTLMRILAGVTVPDSGTIRIDGETVDPGRFSPLRSRARGIRIVYQELSLCDSLTVAENFYLEEPQLGAGRPVWRARYERLARESIEAIFPDSGIDVRAPVGDLPIAQRQMVEIARAASDPGLKLLILDEPTSSLDAPRSLELRRYMASRVQRGVSFIFISHKLPEVAAVADRVLVMRGGRLIWESAADAIPVPRMVELMAGEATHTAAALAHHPDPAARPSEAEVLAEVAAGGRFSAEGVRLHRGEIVGIAGLEGSGQRPFIHALHAAARRRGAGAGIACGADAAFIPGDRVAEGIFPLWTVLANATIGRHARGPALRWLDPRDEAAAAEPWLRGVRLDASRILSPIVELSGGNQQKALMARALLTDADILVLDDPTRGVDIGVKQDFYRLIREAADRGKLVVWYSSEDTEFLECDRVLVFHDGRIVRELRGEAVSEDSIVNASFQGRIEAAGGRKASADAARWGRGLDPFRLVPLLTMLAIFAVIALLNGNALSLFGVDLLMSAAVPLVLVALGQTFVIGGSEIDLGAGAFAGLVSVLAATLLVDQPFLGALALAAALLAYCVLGLLIRLRRIPAIVVSLGASFVWIGTGYSVQPTPGGSSPDWLSAATSFTLGGIPASVCVIVAAALLAFLLNASRTGVVLRGFGANPRALEQAGWSPVRAYLTRYLIAGGFVLVAGLAMTAINTASDINSGGSYTLLSIAAAVIGGCSLVGGSISPLGVACGAVTLSLIGSLLGFLGVSTDYNAAVQGGLLIATLMLRGLAGRRIA